MCVCLLWRRARRMCVRECVSVRMCVERMLVPHLIGRPNNAGQSCVPFVCERNPSRLHVRDTLSARKWPGLSRPATPADAYRQMVGKREL